VIDIQTLEDMFTDLRAKTSWDLDGPLLWGYFFTDSSGEKLRGLVPVLENKGFRFVDLFTPELDEGQAEYYFLHVEKVETHSVATLHARNQELESLACQHDIDTYDGMDVGPVPAA
jgi:hypothetical protein